MADSCSNCGSDLDGDYCARCGQSSATLDVPVGRFASELASETFALDGRLRTTLRPLFLSPGSVARAYVAGQRARFVPPIRMYLFASFAMFLVLTRTGGAELRETSSGSATIELASESADSAAEADRAPGADSPGPDSPPSGSRALDSGTSESAVTDSTDSDRVSIQLDLGGGGFEESLRQRLQEGFARVAADQERFNQEFLGRAAQAMFFLLPAFALLLKMVYRKRLYVHHVVFAIYLHAFAFLLVTAAEVPDAIGMRTLGTWSDLLVLWVPPYLVVAMRRFYGSSWFGAFTKATVVSVGYSILSSIVLIGVLTLAVLNT